MFGRKGELRCIRPQEAGVGEELDVRGDGGIEDCLVLREALPEVRGRDEEDFLGTREGGGEGCGLGIVGVANLDAECCEVRSLFDAADGSDDLSCRYFFQQLMDDVASKLAGCAGDYDHLLSPSTPMAERDAGHRRSIAEVLTLRKYVPGGKLLSCKPRRKFLRAGKRGAGEIYRTRTARRAAYWTTSRRGGERWCY